MLAPFERNDGEFPYPIHHDLQETMGALVGIFRNEEDLKKALIQLDALKPRLAKVRIDGSRMFNPGWHLTRDLKNMLLISEAVARCALARKESRGAHSRIDFPNYDPEWEKKNNVISKDGGVMQLQQRPVPEMPAELKQLLEEKK